MQETFKTLTGNPDLVGDAGFSQPPNNPFTLLNKWVEIADQSNISEPRGLTLATVNSDGYPSTRVVFLRSITPKGIIFATSEESNKGKDLKINPYAAGTLWWRETLQQINFQGYVHKLSSDESDHFFETRTKEAKAIATLSHQSVPLKDENILKEAVYNLIHNQNDISRPPNWHAYLLEISSIEFWHGSTSRLHKRLKYDLINEQWQHQRLQP
ncbi:MAG: pyridoxal 5'-phosphate synthase [Alphaproteobacteria bacterium]|nr:pyridoxal 5'-phosphate synthase [Alphaproteobacteria bacterium]